MSNNRISNLLSGVCMLSLILTALMLFCQNDAIAASQKGRFMAGPVEGLTYLSDSYYGKTDSEGEFRYQEGDQIRFMLGTIFIGDRVEASPVMTPIDVVPDASDDTDPTVLNISRFLQTLDENNDPTDGIRIPAQIRNRAWGLFLDFTLPEELFEFTAQLVINILYWGNAPTLVSAEDAQAHLHSSLLAMAETTRDDKGVWFISGEEYPYSVYEAMGYAVAQDRLWQAELYRRSGRGRLAEIFGSGQLSTDIFVRTTSYSTEELQEGFDALDKETRMIIAGYVAGFNRRIAEVREDTSLLPFEFAALSLVPEDWSVVDVLGWLSALMRNFDPGGSPASDNEQVNNAVLFQELVEKFGQVQGTDMFDDLRWGIDPEAITYIPGTATTQAVVAAPAKSVAVQAEAVSSLTESTVVQAEAVSSLAEDTGSLPDFKKIAAEISQSRKDVVEKLKEINAYVKMGSYAWAVSGDKTASGNPMLYSGPQMGFSVPAIVLEGSIQAGGLSVSGVSVAGIPGIIIGRTPHHAWSMQVGHANTADYYIEDPSAPVLHRTEIIKVAGGADVSLPVYRTSHGPVISPMPYNPDTYEASADNPIISWKYSQWGYELEGVRGFVGLGRATGMDEFGEAVENLAVSLHLCYADKDGNIAYWMSGRDPVRPASDYRFPQGFLPGASVAEWDAAVLRSRSTDRNNSQGFYTGWNSKTSPEYENSYNCSWYFFGPFQRAHVLREYLSSHDNLTFEEVRDLALNIAATDSHNLGGNPWAFVSDAFSAAVEADPTGARTAALALLGDWNDHFMEGGPANWITDTDRSDAWMLMDAWIREAIRLIFEDELGTEMYEKQEINVLFNAMLHGLAGQSSGIVNKYDWFQNTADATAPQTPETIIVAALDNALAALGAQPWGAGKRGEITYSHAFIGPIHTTPFASRATYDQCVEVGSDGPVRIETMFPLGESGNILMNPDGTPAFDPNYFGMTEVFDTFAYRDFPLFE